MSEAKRPGVRDISDLKARLGLKKGPAKKGGVVPPPGVRGAAVPAPPGAEPPRTGPKVSDDPFGALNAVAAQAPARPVEQIVVKIEKDEHIESVERKAAWVRVAKYAGLMLAPLIVGVAVGQIGTKAKQFNRTIADAGKISDEIKEVRKSMRDYQNAFAKGKKNGFTSYDPALTEELGKVKFHSPDQEKIYKSWLYELSPSLVADTLYFASEAEELAKEIKAHVSLTKRDLKNLQAAIDNKKKATPPTTESGNVTGKYRYAFFAQVPTQEEAQQGKKQYGGMLVELGLPLSGANVCETGECEGPISGFRYRTGADEPWKTMDVNMPAFGSGTIAADKLVPILENPTTEAIMRGSEPSLAEVTYMERVTRLAAKVEELVTLGQALENDLAAQAGAGEKFTFFL